MGVKIENLSPRVQPIANRLCKQADGAFNMTDILAAALLFLENKSVEEVFKLIQIARSADGPALESDAIVADIPAERAKKKQTRRSRRTGTR